MSFIAIVFQITVITIGQLVTVDGNKLTEGTDRIYYTDKNVPYTGEAVYYADKKKEEEGNFKEGRQNGVWKYYFNNGKITIEGKYVHGAKDSHWNYYSRDGKIIYTACYFNGRKVWEKGVRPDGEDFFCFFRDGRPQDGVAKESYPWGLASHIDTRGNLYEEKYVSYRAGEKSGSTIWFGPDKKILAEGNYLNDERWEGKFVIPMGSFLWKIESYRAGAPDGEVRYYAIGGIMEKKGNNYFEYKMIELKPYGVYKDGQKWNGMFIRYWPEKNGWMRMFYKDGKLEKKEYTEF